MQRRGGSTGEGAARTAWAPGRAAGAGVAAAALLGACAAPDYAAAGSPFTCAVDGVCPAGFECRSNLCVRTGAGALPTLLEVSATPVAPALYPDVDRGGVVACWTTQEDAALGVVHGAFVGPTGAVSPAVELAAFDQPTGTFVAGCAPIPHTGGQVLVAAWENRGALDELRLAVWTPRTPGGTAGAAAPFYYEPSPAFTQRGGYYLHPAVVGDEVWVPFETVLPATIAGGITTTLFPAEVRRLRVGAADVAAGHPVRELVQGLQFTFGFGVAYAARGAGAWLSADPVFPQFQYYPAARPVLSDPRLAAGAAGFAELSANAGWFGFGQMLAATQAPYPGPTGDAGPGPAGPTNGAPAEQVAILYPDPNEPAAVGPSYRVAWVSQIPGATARNAALLYTVVGPVLPFRRVDTSDPGGFVADGYLYFFGAPRGPGVAPAAVDAGVADAAGGAADAAAGDGGAALDAAAPPGGDPGAALVALPAATLVMYRVPWGATDGAAVEAVRPIAPRLTQALVTATAAQPLPGAASGQFALAWVEYYPPDSVGHGVRYAIYAQQFSLSPPGQ